MTDDKQTLLELRRKQLQIIDEEIKDLNRSLDAAEDQIDRQTEAFRPDQSLIDTLKHIKGSIKSKLFIQKCDRDIVLTEIKILSLKF